MRGFSDRVQRWRDDEVHPMDEKRWWKIGRRGASLIWSGASGWSVYLYPWLYEPEEIYVVDDQVMEAKSISTSSNSLTHSLIH